MGRAGTDFDDVKGGGREKKSRPEDKVDVYHFPEKKWIQMRVLGKVFAYAGYWIAGKNKEGKPIKYYVECPSFDPATQERDSTIYDPWRDAEAKLRAKAESDGEDMKNWRSPIQFVKNYWVCMISRSLQRKFNAEDNKPTKIERTTGFKDKDSDTLTPVVAVRIPTSLAGKIKGLKELNTIESRSGEVKCFPVSHPKYGCDIRVLYDSDKAPSEQYQVVPREAKTPLTEEELAYLLWDLSDLSSADSEEGTRANFERWALSMGFKVNAGKKKKKVEDADEDDEPAPKKSKKVVDEDFDEDEDDDEPAPKKKATAKKKKVVDEDEDDFDGEDDDEPAPKKKVAAKKKKVVDEDEDDFDSDDEEDEPAPKKKKKVVDEDDFDDDEDEPAPKKKTPAKKKKVVDEDDFDDDEDDEPAPAKKKSKKVVDEDDDFEDDDEPAPKKKAPAKKKKVVDEDDDFDADEDDDDEPAPKKKAPAKKKKVVDEDDDFDDDDD